MSRMPLFPELFNRDHLDDMLENVTGFLSSNRGQDFATIARRLSDLGYRLDAFVLDACHFTPQSRPRVFVIGLVPGLEPEEGPPPGWLWPVEQPSALRTRPIVQFKKTLGLGARRHPLDSHPPVGGVGPRQHLGRAVAGVLVRLPGRLALGLPNRAGLRHRLERPRPVAAPHRQADRLARRAGVLGRLLSGSASGSVAVAMPALRLYGHGQSE